MVFARQLSALGRRGDIALGLSTSGNSRNLLHAFEAANRLGMMTIGIAGYDGGQNGRSRHDRFPVRSALALPYIVSRKSQTTIYQMLWELTQAFLRPGE